MSRIPRGAIPEAAPMVGFGPGLVDEDLSLSEAYRQRPPWMRPEDHAHMLEGLRKASWEG
jgi:hypothetical protein